jgi:hypothetical protein
MKMLYGLCKVADKSKTDFWDGIDVGRKLFLGSLNPSASAARGKGWIACAPAGKVNGGFDNL